MFVTDKLIYLQMQKTACTHIASLLSKHIGGQQIGKHNYLEDFNTKKFICGSIRNPWDWYVSLWAFGCKTAGSGFLHWKLVNTGFLTFPNLLNFVKSNKYGPYNFTSVQIKDILDYFFNEFKKPIFSWRESYKDYKSSEGFRKWLKLIFDPSRIRDLYEGYSLSSICEFAGLMTYRYCGFFHRDFFNFNNFKNINNIEELKKFDKNNNILDYIIRVEFLEEDFIKMLEKAGYNIDEKTKDQIRKSGKTNVSNHLKTSHYYDKETIKLVAEKEKLIIEKYNYKPPL
ncbi:hypothetical protein AYK20_02190 [Thermoplasmatales archaeon SG8-52-1]|nr:MAG: hypothetical protein AYK20_02190 [Thermoplasmatales archaeon SG8-52-1]